MSVELVKFSLLNRGIASFFKVEVKTKKCWRMEGGGVTTRPRKKIEKKRNFTHTHTHTHTPFSYTCVQKKSKLCLHVMYLHDELI